MDTVPGFSIKSGLFHKSKAPVFYKDDYGYLYPPLIEGIEAVEQYNKGLLFDFSGIYLGKPALRSARALISKLSAMEIWLYSGVRDLDDLIDAVVLEPKSVFVSTATAQSLKDMKEMFEAAEIAALAIDMDSKGNIIWHTSTDKKDIDSLLAMAEKYDLMGLGIFFWDGDISSNISRATRSYNIGRLLEVIAEWRSSGWPIPIFFGGPFIAERTPNTNLIDHSNIYIVIPYDMMD